ncbi:uncharacterized protein BDR25DRAFT_369351 [Lindgomyces ingoldianus]|uniref:Uncharacterized protein n=1 Tax=Lindgomyces ingoldianus TaxID=673940 RepID=A0ACB6QVD4_9PLEO|nr:uncharacterized protein BDR25DRAFT_369351 [Lindgomyces ingoldianus]KAF2470822.1 hypothetical protein BDR25DRAFT_369351 [Lindgomyces ingoldianus]
MASSCSTFSLAPSLPMKIVPYVPSARKHKPKPKANAKATTRTAGYNISEANSYKDSGEWFDINDFPMPDSNASRSFNPGVLAPLRDADPSGSLDQAIEFPLIVESDAAEGNHSATHVEPSNGASDYQENGYRAAAGSEGYRAGQDGHLDADGVRAFSVEDMESIRHDSLLAQDNPLFGDVSVTDGPSATRKGTHSSSVDTMIISPAAVPDVTPEPELEDPRSGFQF